MKLQPVTKVKMPKLKFDLTDSHICNVMKKVQFIDIETNIKLFHSFRTGNQYLTIDKMAAKDETKVLTVAGGSMYDLYTKGEKGVWSFGNHHFKTRFKKDPEDDTEVLKHVWNILDSADVVVAHNGSFDEKWLRGRFLSLGWKQPSKFSLVCTYRGLKDYNLDSKKLDYLSNKLCGTSKLSTDVSLWIACKTGDVKAFKAMEKYNRGDIYNTLFKVYMRTCQYYPDYSVDMTNHNSPDPQCRVTGEKLVKLRELYTNHSTGKQYFMYKNKRNGLVYRDRYCITSKNAGVGRIRGL